MTDVDALRRALDAPWDRWAVFLHPDQHALVKKQFNGPARIAGSAGTGKTVVALHRAVWLARKYPAAPVLLTTFSGVLARPAEIATGPADGRRRRLLARITVEAIDAVGLDLHQKWLSEVRLATDADLRTILTDAAAQVPDVKFSDAFIWSEWVNTVDAWQLRNWEAYRDVPRLGRKRGSPKRNAGGFGRCSSRRSRF